MSGALVFQYLVAEATVGHATISEIVASAITRAFISGSSGRF
jgi:hypothetical protein